jgi:hypothetical protein
MVELVAPSVTSTSLGDRLPVSPTLLEAALGAADPDLALVELTRHGYLVADLGPDELRAEWWYVEPSDPSSQVFGAGRASARAPMALRVVDQPLVDPVPTTTTTTTTTTSAAPGDAGRGSDDGIPLPALGGAAALAAAAGAVVALRRRR